MARATMGQTVDEISASVPLRTLRAVGLVGPAFQEKQLPAGDGETLIERKREIVGRSGVANGGPRHQERIKRAVVLVVDVGEMVVGKGRVEMLPGAVDTLAHGAGG